MFGNHLCLLFSFLFMNKGHFPILSVCDARKAQLGVTGFALGRVVKGEVTVCVLGTGMWLLLRAWPCSSEKAPLFTLFPGELRSSEILNCLDQQRDWTFGTGPDQGGYYLGTAWHHKRKHRVY